MATAKEIIDVAVAAVYQNWPCFVWALTRRIGEINLKVIRNLPPAMSQFSLL